MRVSRPAAGATKVFMRSFMSLKLLYGAVGILVLSPVLAAAQTAPSPSQVAPRLPPLVGAPSSRITLPGAGGGAEIPPQADKLRFCLIDFIVEGEFEDLIEARRRLAEGLAGRCMAVSEIYKFAALLQQAYVRAGYLLARVIVPPQALDPRSRVKIKVIAGFIEGIEAGSIGEPGRSRVLQVVAPLIGQSRLTQAQLERGLLLGGETPGVELNATFTKGKNEGGSILVLSGRYKPVNASLYSDNALPNTFGRAQMSAVVSANTWLGLGEQFTLSATGLPDRDIFGNEPTRRYLSGQLALPIGVDGWRFEIIGTHGTTIPRVNQTSATRGTLDQWRMRLAYDAVKSRDFELTFAARFDATDERLESTALSPATALSVDRVRPVRGELSGVWRLRESGTTLTYGAVYSRGTPWLDARKASDASVLLPLSRQGADAVFNKFEGRLEVAQALPLGFTGGLSLYGQTGFGDPLLNSEQMDIVGYRMLSGFDLGSFAGDKVWVGRFELGYPVPFIARGIASSWTPYLFAAMGERVYEAPTALEQRLLHATNYGAGLRALITETATGTMLYGFIEYSRQNTNRLVNGTSPDSDRVYVGALLRH